MQLDAKPENCICKDNKVVKGCPIHDPRRNLPYELFCYGNPLYKDCAGVGYCRRDRACND